MVVPGYDMESSRRAVEIAEAHEGVYATVGVHPHDAKTVSTGDLSMLAALAETRRVVGIGEVGLDFYRNLSPPDTQGRAFREQLALAREVQLPVVVHSRDADEAVFEVLAEHVQEVGGARKHAPLGMMHCFAGDLRLAERYIAIGFLISIAGPVTYATAEKTRDVARSIPLESLLIETDAPYLTPQTHRGKRNEPAFVIETARYIADLRGVTLDRIAAATAVNAARLFALDRVPQPTGERA
jgi:TatD DNase family protein